ncbi:MAG: aspartate--tRNA ligase [Candidatus Doudnabacteria bacterium]|nr:aspartate--tRNA ligase [Candidatus Doudnabacteria bacterium]
MSRTLSADTPHLVGEQVTVSGWAASTRDHGGLIFIDLRDHTGVVQLTIHPEAAEAFKVAETVRDEFVIRASGMVTQRETNLVNPNIASGTVELVVTHIQILNASKPLPFPVFSDVNISEDLRLQYRFLDLRRQKMQEMLKNRADYNMRIRSYMTGHGFVEVTTPILTSSSPEGARDYLVPSRIHPGKFYALPQAPQQFKQLLMVGGLPRYYQIAPCFRDEDPRADRHPGEFYQLDLEMSFAEQGETVWNEIEPLIISLVEDFAGKKVLQKPVPRIPYAEAMEKYGSDKPDLRFGMEMVELTEELKDTQFSVFANAIKNGGCVKAIRCEGGAKLSRSQIDALTELVRKEGAGGLAYIVLENGEKKSPILKFLSETEITAIASKTDASDGDIVFFGADERSLVNKVLGKLRSKLGDDFGLKDPNIIALAWITDFPMYEWSENENKVDFSHNPFSMPQGGLEALSTQDPLAIKADQYDMVANGYEICSGAIRNYNPAVMYKAFEIVGIDKATVDEKFGGMIRAFEFGAPPHGGCAFGLDRLFMVLRDEPNIREVIAFPKNGSAEDLMMSAPGSVDDKQLKELHIKLDLPPKKQ